MKTLALFALVTVAAACSSTASVKPGPDGGGDAASSGDGGAPPADGGILCRAGAPTVHRSAPVACASHDTDGGVIDAGPITCGQPLVPHDACLVDGDCSSDGGTGGACECQSPGGMGCGVPVVTGNVCVPSDCRTDSDCTCGYCAGEVTCGVVDAYHCVTPRDECTTDADCQGGGLSSACRWSTDHWACVSGLGCAG